LIGQKHFRIFVLNLCYADSAEQIVYGRPLQRLRRDGLDLPDVRQAGFQ
jgi:hypothetical protein